MKLIIQIPCLNEETTLPAVLAALPRQVPGFASVEVLVIDDGSTDRTVEVAHQHGVDHVVSLPVNRGLAKAFVAGLDACLARGADVIVNTDADNQYEGADIPALVEPIVAGRAEIVIGSRPIDQIAHFSFVKKRLQRLGSWIVRQASRTSVPDAPSGFRAFSRSAAMKLNVFSDYTYTLETIIQAGQMGMAVESVPVRTNPQTRPSRLIRSLPRYLERAIMTIVRILMTYRSLSFFALPGAISFGLGSVLGGRFLYYYLTGDGSGHIQSVILAALLLGSGFFLVITGLVADLISVNRKLLEDLRWRLRKLEEGGSISKADQPPPSGRRSPES